MVPRKRLSADDLHVIEWYVDASFAVHNDFKSHTGGAMSIGTRVPISECENSRQNHDRYDKSRNSKQDDSKSSDCNCEAWINIEGVT
jgi:hypothetical protein